MRLAVSQQALRAIHLPRTQAPAPHLGKRKSDDGRGGQGSEVAAHVKWAKYRKNRKKCVHGKGVYECGACGGKRMCEHDKQGVSRQRVCAAPSAPVVSAKKRGFLHCLL